MIPSPRVIASARISVGDLAERDDRDASARRFRRSEEHGARVRLQQLERALRDPLEDRLELEQPADLATELGERRHLARAALGLVVQARVLDRDADVRRDRRQQPTSALAEPPRLLDALDADHADRLSPATIGTPRYDFAGVPTVATPISSNAAARLSSIGSRVRRILDVSPSPNGIGGVRLPVPLSM